MTVEEIPGHWIEAAHRGFVDAWSLMARISADGDADEFDGIAVSATGLSISGCNAAMAYRVPDDPQSALAAATQFYARLNLPWTLYASPAAATALEPFTQSSGLTRMAPEPAMFLKPQNARQPVRTPGFDIQAVRDATSMQVYRATAAQGFGIPEQGIAIWARPELLPEPGLLYYLGVLDGKPVATGCIYVLHGIGTVNMVSTVETHRRQGLGEQIVWRAIEDGLALGSEAIFLHASEMGYSLYERMGFRHTFSYNTWSTQLA